MNQISWLSLGKALRGGNTGWVSFGRGGEEASATAWHLALLGVLDSHRASWKLVQLRRGWRSPHSRHLDQCTRPCVGHLPRDSQSEENPSSPQNPPSLPWVTSAGKRHAKVDAWRAFPNPPGTNLPGHYVDVLLSPPTLAQLLKPCCLQLSPSPVPSGLQSRALLWEHKLKPLRKGEGLVRRGACPPGGEFQARLERKHPRPAAKRGQEW